MRWVGLALFGILVAAAVSVAASRLASQQIGLASQPIEAGDALAPVTAMKPAPRHRPRHRHPPAPVAPEPAPAPPPTEPPASAEPPLGSPPSTSEPAPSEPVPPVGRDGEAGGADD